MRRSTALGYEKSFYKKLVNPNDREIENFDHQNTNLPLLYEADKRNFDLPQTSALQKGEKLHDRYPRKLLSWKIQLFKTKTKTKGD
uniref:Uncharacterized protein n=1 Tax=Romanomermis culicivorax TaxID=13658 RepID=A0A915JFI0_ROMCU